VMALVVLLVPLLRDLVVNGLRDAVTGLVDRRDREALGPERGGLDRVAVSARADARGDGVLYAVLNAPEGGEDPGAARIALAVHWRGDRHRRHPELERPRVTGPGLWARGPPLVAVGAARGSQLPGGALGTDCDRWRGSAVVLKRSELRI